jgi:ribosome-associated protein
MRTFEIKKEPIELYKILKFEGLASSGGEAKNAIAEGQVLVNGAVETRKRKQIVNGDKVEFAGETIVVNLTV